MWQLRGWALLSALLFVPLISTAASDADGVEFFEKRVRPVLAEHCYSCHSAKAEKLKGGLLLDTKDGVLKGGDSGAAIVPGDPDRSLVIKAVRYTDENLQMPPKGKKLAAEQIADLEAWVKMGAPDPRTATAQTAKPDALAHWAFKPIQKPAVPPVKSKRWVQTPVDAFILAALESKGIEPSKRADKRTLIRRATFDLTGLPPNATDIEAFLEDRTSDAFAKVVDRLLASQHYGERWGRYWLDVARYADTKGYVFEEERRFPYSYTYRDYVIRAFNEDLPFNDFIVQQIAADQLELGEDKRPLAALGFLTLGRRFLNNQHDIIDDRIDVVSRGFMGLTVTCARCHDHKFDPIPIRDYYSLYGVFASSSEPGEKPLLGTKALPGKYDEYLAEHKKRQTEHDEFRSAKEAEALGQLRQRAGEYMLAAHDAQRLNDTSKGEALARERKLDPGVVQKWASKLDAWKKEATPLFVPWFEFAAIDGTNFAEQAVGVVERLKSSPDAKLNSAVVAALSSERPKTMKEVSERYGKLFTETDKKWTELVEKHKKDGGDPPSALSDAAAEELRQVLFAADSPARVEPGELMRLFDVPAAQRVRALKRKVDELDATHSGAPPRAMALVDNPSPTTPVVFIRGNARNRGAEVPRQFLEFLAGAERKPFEKGSGRIELAESIASPKNPLTARVIVNRVWMNHFGSGLVRTPSDFGVRADPPSHPELLDYLAAWFIEEGWSLKKLHRLILLSSVWQQRNEDREDCLKVDPGNTLLWKMNRRRLEFEAMRDTLLSAAGRLDRAIGGRSVELTSQPFSRRRTVYGYIERQNLPSMFRTFDFANPDTTSPQRFSTTVPQQALFMINSPFVVEQARYLAKRTEGKTGEPVDERIRRFYWAAFQRDPTHIELSMAKRFVHSQRRVPVFEPETPPWQYGYGEFDESAGRVKSFARLPEFANNAWQGGSRLPDDKLGWVQLTATGGHTGNDIQHAAIRRWVAPRDGTISITGRVGHDSDKGDGVRARIVSSKRGQLGVWTVHNKREETKLEGIAVAKDETIDFVVDCKGSVDSDSFNWAPMIRMTAMAPDPRFASPTAEWDAKSDFSGSRDLPKPHGLWEKFAQVLLMSNELMFVD